MFEKVEAELKDLKETEDVKARARRLLLLHGLSAAAQPVRPRDIISQGNEGSAQVIKSEALRAYPES